MNPFFTSINGLITYSSLADNQQHAGVSVIYGPTDPANPNQRLVAQCSLDGRTITFVPRNDAAAGQQAQIKDNLAVFAPDRKFIHDESAPRFGFALAPQDAL